VVGVGGGQWAVGSGRWAVGVGVGVGVVVGVGGGRGRGRGGAPLSARCTYVSKATVAFSKGLALRTPELRSEAGGVRQRAMSPASEKVAAVVTD
jgi:hypothetical protein